MDVRRGAKRSHPGSSVDPCQDAVKRSAWLGSPNLQPTDTPTSITSVPSPSNNATTPQERGNLDSATYDISPSIEPGCASQRVGSNTQTVLFHGTANINLYDHSTFQNMGLSAADKEIRARADIMTLRNLYQFPSMQQNAEYLPDSRTETVQHILSLIQSHTTPSLIWLHGAADLGKSTLISHLAGQLKCIRKLAAYIPFKRDSTGNLPLTSIFEAIARQIVEHFPSSQPAVISAMERLISASDYKTLLEAFVLEPIASIKDEDRDAFAVILIDGMDEYSDAAKLAEALLSSVETANTLHLYFVVASRDEPDIREALQALHPQTVAIGLADAPVIARFFQSHLSTVRKALWTEEGDPEQRIPMLVSAADGLFVWAATACAFIANRTARGSASDRLALVLQPGTSHSTPKRLYAIALDHLFPDPKMDPDNVLSSSFPFILAILMVIQEPMTAEDVEDLVQYDYPITHFAELLRSLQTRSSPDGYITPSTNFLHTSFLDYLKEGCKSRFHITPEIIREAHMYLARKFIARIIKYFTAYPYNSTANIPKPILYASSKWMGHANNFDLSTWRDPLDPRVSEELNRFFTSKAFVSWAHLCHDMAGMPYRTEPPSDIASALQGFAHAVDVGFSHGLSNRNVRAEASYAQLLVVKLRGWTSEDLELLGNLYFQVWKWDGPASLHLALLSIREHALSLCPNPHPNRYTSLCFLAICLREMVEQFGAPSDLDRAIALNKEALDLRPPDSSSALISLANCMQTRYELKGDPADLTQAIQLNEDSLSLYPPGHPDRFDVLNNLASTLKFRYDQDGMPRYLDRAIKLREEAHALLGPESPSLSLSLINLAVDLCSRYELQGKSSDLDRAIKLGESALILNPPGHPSRSLTLHNLAYCITARYQENKDFSDLERIIQLETESVDLCPYPNPDRPASLHSLALSHQWRYDHTKSRGDLQRAISLVTEAISLAPPTHIEYQTYCETLDGFRSLQL